MKTKSYFKFVLFLLLIIFGNISINGQDTIAIPIRIFEFYNYNPDAGTSVNVSKLIDIDAKSKPIQNNIKVIINKIEYNITDSLKIRKVFQKEGDTKIRFDLLIKTPFVTYSFENVIFDYLYLRDHLKEIDIILTTNDTGKLNTRYSYIKISRLRGNMLAFEPGFNSFDIPKVNFIILNYGSVPRGNAPNELTE